MVSFLTFDPHMAPAPQSRSCSLSTPPRCSTTTCAPAGRTRATSRPPRRRRKWWGHRSLKLDPECYLTRQRARFDCLFVCLRHQSVLMLAEAGCLDPRIFCTSCMVSVKHKPFTFHSSVPLSYKCVYTRFHSQTKKPMRTNHCFFCDACVAKHDHHSVWINGCIGTERSVVVFFHH